MELKNHFSIQKIASLFSHRITLVLSFLILLPPFILEDIGVGIDPSWKIGLGLASLNNLTYGKDVIFTYGPLHFLITKVGVLYEFKWLVVVFEFFVIGLFLKILSDIYTNEDHLCKGVFIVLFAFLVSDVSCEHYLLLIFLYSIYQVLINQNAFYLYLIFCIAVLTFFVKINYGFVNFSVMVVVYIIYGFKNLRKAYITIILAVLYFVAIYLLSYSLRVDLKGYISNGIVIIQDYNDAMMLPFSVTDFVDWIGIIISSILLLVFLKNWSFFLRRNHISFTLILLLYCFLFFKNGYVRADIHVFFFIFNSLIFYLIFFIWNNKLVFLNTAFVLTLALAFLSIPAGFANYNNQKDSSFDIRNFKQKILFWRYWIELFSDLEAKSTFTNLQKPLIHLNNNQLDSIANNTVDILPFDIFLVQKHHLNYQPRPIIQSYAAYNLTLDSLNSEKYNGLDAPVFLVSANKTIDNRVPFWDESITKRSISRNYELVGVEMKAEECLLFKKRISALKCTTKLIKSFVSKLGAAVEVPNDSLNLYLYLDVEYSNIGKLRRLFFQAQELKVEFTFEDFTTEIYSCAPSILKTGVLSNKFVRTNEEAYYFFKGRHDKIKKIKKIRFLSDGGFVDSIQGRFISYQEMDSR